MDSTPHSVGRGRGSGVPVLPSGMWESLNGINNEIGAIDDTTNRQHDDTEKDYAPMAFGKVRGGRRFEKSIGEEGGRGRGRGIQRDAKGKDWECPSCTNVNWSWRTNCNKCNTGKPVIKLTETEIRDGVGKGFNERQERASLSTVEIDEDGFDDFGRRVKKSDRDRKAKEAAALNRLTDKYKFFLSNEDDNPVDKLQFEDASEKEKKYEDNSTKMESNRTHDKSHSYENRQGDRHERQDRSRDENRRDFKKPSEKKYSMNESHHDRRQAGRSSTQHGDRYRDDSYRSKRSRSRSNSPIQDSRRRR